MLSVVHLEQRGKQPAILQLDMRLADVNTWTAGVVSLFWAQKKDGMGRARISIIMNSGALHYLEEMLNHVHMHISQMYSIRNYQT